MAWSGFGQTHLDQKQVGVQESLSWFWWNTTNQLPVSHFQTRFHSSTDGLDCTAQNQPGSGWGLADNVRSGLNRSGPEARWCARISWPTSELIQIPWECLLCYHQNWRSPPHSQREPCGLRPQRTICVCSTLFRLWPDQ